LLLYETVQIMILRVVERNPTGILSLVVFAWLNSLC